MDFSSVADSSPALGGRMVDLTAGGCIESRSRAGRRAYFVRRRGRLRVIAAQGWCDDPAGVLRSTASRETDAVQSGLLLFWGPVAVLGGQRAQGGVWLARSHYGRALSPGFFSTPLPARFGAVTDGSVRGRRAPRWAACCLAAGAALFYLYAAPHARPSGCSLEQDVMNFPIALVLLLLTPAAGGGARGPSPCREVRRWRGRPSSRRSADRRGDPARRPEVVLPSRKSR